MKKIKKRFPKLKQSLLVLWKPYIPKGSEKGKEDVNNSKKNKKESIIGTYYNSK